MPAEGVGDALNLCRRVLRPGGVVVEYHPEPGPLLVDVRVGERLTRVGELGGVGERPVLARIPPMRAAVDAVVATGAFVRDRELGYEFLWHCERVEDFLAYTNSQAFPLVPPEEMLERARDLLAGHGEDAELIVRDRRRLTRLARAR